MKIFGGSGENETRKKKDRKKKEDVTHAEMEVTEELKIVSVL